MPVKSPLKIAAATAIGLLSLALLIAVIVLASRPTPQCDSNAGDQNKWYSQMRQRKECSRGWKQYPVIMVSLDGFRADYLKLNMTSSIEWLIEVGSHSPYMYSSYPTKTFPNHYTIVTGLYPESHGIIDNSMYDPTVGSTEAEHQFTMSNSNDPGWWLGEPLWNTVQRNNLKSAALYWAGSDKKINGLYPSYWNAYNKSATFYSRVDKIIEWLSMPDETRPSLINVYFQEPDATGHDFGPHSDKLLDQLIRVDGMMHYLMESLSKNELIGCVNLIVTADHGMQEITKDIFLDKYEKLNMQNVQVFSGPVARIMMHKSTDSIQVLVDKIKKLNLPIRVYTKRDIPRRLHFSGSRRIGDIIIDCDSGVKVWDSNSSYYYVVADHGYDFRFPEMHALFVAAGPSIKSGFVVAEPFQNVELYNLVADLLNLQERAPNNGTDGLMHQIMVDPPVARKQNTLLTENCKENTEPLINCGEVQLPVKWPERKTSKYSVDVVSTSVEHLCLEANEHYNVLHSAYTNSPVSIWTKLHSNMDIVNNLDNDLTTGDNPTCAEIQSERKKLTDVGKGLYPLLPVGRTEIDSTSTVWLVSKWKYPIFEHFYQKVWKYLLAMVVDYSKQFGAIACYVGPVYDYDNDGLFDSMEIMNLQKMGNQLVPTHFYCILLNCTESWTADGTCSGEAKAMAFILPHTATDVNEPLHSYVYSHTARVRDIELATGLRFFESLKPDNAIVQRLHINQEMWPSLKGNVNRRYENSGHREVRSRMRPVTQSTI